MWNRKKREIRGIMKWANEQIRGTGETERIRGRKKDLGKNERGD